MPAFKARFFCDNCWNKFDEPFEKGEECLPKTYGVGYYIPRRNALLDCPICGSSRLERVPLEDK